MSLPPLITNSYVKEGEGAPQLATDLLDGHGDWRDGRAEVGTCVSQEAEAGGPALIQAGAHTRAGEDRTAAPTPPLQFQSPERCRNLCPTRLSAKEGLKASNAVSGNSTLRRHARLTRVGSSPIIILPGNAQDSGSDAGGSMPSRDLVRLTRRKFLCGVSALTVISSHLQGASSDAVTPFVAGTQVDAFKTAQARCSA